MGRDKLLRTLQYFARFYGWYLYRTNHPNSDIAPWVAMRTQFGLTRRIMLAGKFIEHLKAAAELYDARAKVKGEGGDMVVQWLQIIRQLGFGVFLGLDTATVADAAGIRKSIHTARLLREAYKAWLVALLASSASCLWQNYQLIQRKKLLNESDGEAKVEAKKIDK